MADFATLVLAADSRGLVAGEQALDRLASTAERVETRTGKALTSVGKAADQAGKQSVVAGQNSRLLAMQLSQVAQQASVTGNFVQALAIQLPDLALGFGAAGIMVGAIAGPLLLFADGMLRGGKEADALSDAMERLDNAVEGYREAIQDTLLPAGDLIEKFGGQAEGAERVYEAMRKIKELEFHEAMAGARDAIAGSLEEISQSIERYDFASSNFMHADAIAAVRTQVALLENQYGLTLVQATRINDALNEMASAIGPGELAQAAMRLGDELGRATDEGAKLSPELREVQKNAYQASLDAAEFARLTGAAVGTANSLAVAVSGVADQYARAAQYASYLTSKYPSQGAYSGVQRSADGPIQGESFPLPETGPSVTRRPLIELDGLPGEFGRARGGRRGGGGGKSQAELYDDLIKDAERRIASLAAEREAVGLSEQAAEKLRAETDMLNDAQQRGIKLTDDQKENISRLAEQMGTLEEETRRAEEQMDFFNDISDDLKDGILDAIVAGEDLDDVFKDLAKTIAKAALEAALFGSGPLAGGGSSGGGFLSFLPKLLSFDGGGYTGSGSRSGGLDGKGGYMALVHPQETIIDHTKGSAAAQAVNVTSDVRVSVDQNGNLQAYVTRTAAQVSDARLGRYDQALPGRISDVMERTG